MNRIKLIVTTIVLVVGTSPNVGAQLEASRNVCHMYPGDEIWLVSAREIDCQAITSPHQLSCLRYVQGIWQPTSWNDLTVQCQMTDLANVVFIHGFRTAFDDAQQRGLQVYERLFCDCRSAGPVRYIIWAWKSEKEVLRPSVDFAIKSRRSMALGDVFAAALNELGSRPATVLAYSLGVQIAVSAMVQSELYCGPPIQLAAIASVSDCRFLSSCPNMSNGGKVDRTFIFLNDGDRAVRAVNRLCRFRFGSDFTPFEEFAVEHSHQMGLVHWIDITPVAPRSHSIVEYSSSPVVQAMIQQIVIENALRNETGSGQAAASGTVVGNNQNGMAPGNLEILARLD